MSFKEQLDKSNKYITFDPTHVRRVDEIDEFGNQPFIEPYRKPLEKAFELLEKYYLNTGIKVHLHYYHDQNSFKMADIIPDNPQDRSKTIEMTVELNREISKL